MFKKITALILVLVLLIGMVPAAQAAPEATVDTDDVTIQGTNGFGNLLSQEINESQTDAAEEAAEYPGGYTVTDLEIEGNTATVTYDTMEEATLVVALYTEDGMRMVTSTTATVTPDTTTATVTFEGEMPEYFLVSAYLLDSYDLSPLCAAYDTPMYTREMQELLASTVDDYDPEKVLNLDDDETTNFAVYADSTIVIEAAEGVNTVAMVDNENSIYIIENADEKIAGLQEGDIFVYPYSDEDVLIVKVGTIAIDDTIVTITGSELEIDEAFSYVKIQSDGGTSDVIIDESTCGEGITYLGSINDANGTKNSVSPNSWEGDASGETAIKVGISKDILPVDNSEVVSTSITISGTLAIAIKAEFEFYVSSTRLYSRFDLEYSVGTEMTFSGKVSTVIDELPRINLISLNVLSIFLDPEFVVSVTGEITVSCTFVGEMGYIVEDGVSTGIKSNPRIENEIYFKGTIFLGLDLNPTLILFLSEVADISLTALVGVEFEGKMNVAQHEITTTYFPDSKHECTRCLAVTIRVKIDLALDFKLLDTWDISANLFNYKLNIGKAYMSFDYSEFGWGTCPHLLYKITASVVDAEGKKIAGASVSIGDETQSSGTNGVAVFFRVPGEYTVTASSDTLADNCQIKVKDQPSLAILVLADEDEEDEQNAPGILGTIDDTEITDNSVIDEVTHNNNRYQLFDISMTWTEAQAYCESIGGHLVTITSQEEQNLIASLLDAGKRLEYWIGTYYSSAAGAYVWVTGEAFTYSNWAPWQPDRHGGKENYGQIFANYYNGTYPRYSWNDIMDTNDPGNNNPYFNQSTIGFICEFEAEVENEADGIGLENGISPNAVYPGDYGTEVTNTYILKTASFKDLVPNEQYVMLAMASVEVADPLAADNLLFIDQAAALEDGTLTFQYVQRTTCDISYVVACGASHKNLKDAEISFPEMVADGELQVVDPIVVYDGETLVEGRDYVVVGKVDFTEAGEYTCSIRGIHNYTGLVECTYTVTTDLTEVASGWSGATEWTLTSDGTLTVYGEGNMKNYGYNGGQPWLDKGVDVTNVVIEEGVTAVGTGAFRNLTTLEAVALPESGLSKIGEAAFYGCTSLREIAIPEGVYTVWAYTFKNCSALTSVKLPRTLIKIDQGAFESAVALPYIYIPTNVEIIGSWSFKGCTALEEAEMTWANATEIREGAFKNCSALTTVQFPTGIQKFGDSAFYGIGAEFFTVPATVTTVGPWCFARAHVKEITFESDAPAIGEGAFNKITLTAFYPGSNATWTADIMQNYGGTVTWKAN